LNNVNPLSFEPIADIFRNPVPPNASLPAAAQTLLGATFARFCTNLGRLRTSNAPDVVHQTRVDWRRFKSAMRLFKPILVKKHIPATAALQPMLKSLGRLRDLDVARYQTLPALAEAALATDHTQEQAWRRITQTFARADRLQRKAARAALLEPEVARALADISQWIADMPTRDALFCAHDIGAADLRAWAKHRIAQLRKELSRAKQSADTEKHQHRIRICAKTLRYSIEMLEPALPHKQVKEWHREATQLQCGIGRGRDLVRAVSLTDELHLPSDLTEILRGIALIKAQTLRGIGVEVF
jgi:CHAD domain-containing protein